MSEREKVAKWLWDTYGLAPCSWEELHPADRTTYLGRADELLALLANREDTK